MVNARYFVLHTLLRRGHSGGSADGGSLQRTAASGCDTQMASKFIVGVDLCRKWRALFRPYFVTV